MHELIQEWLAANGDAWRKRLASRLALPDAHAQELLSPAVEQLLAVLRRGRLDLVDYVRGADAAGLVAMADARGLALHHGIDIDAARSALAALAPAVLDLARRVVKTPEGVARLLADPAAVHEAGAFGDLAQRLYRTRSP